MRTLKVSEIYQVSGSSKQDLYDGIAVGGFFSSIFSTAGGILGGYWFLQSGNTAYNLTTFFAAYQGHALLTLPFAVFAGIGIGGCIGAITGLGLYYSGLASKPES
jgi:hypothetical protein